MSNIYNSKHDPKVYELSDAISDISEDFWCAGWLIDVEYDLFAMICGDRDRDYGFGKVSHAELDHLDELSHQIGGWIYWSDADDGETFIPMNEWETMYEKWKQDHQING